MDEAAYQNEADKTFRRIEDLFKDVDPDDVECERSGDVITLTLKGGQRCIINTQRPTRQLWLAANARAWHFSYDAGQNQWLDDKKTGAELFATIARTVKEAAGIDLTL
jgi:CyaY protein